MRRTAALKSPGIESLPTIGTSFSNSHGATVQPARGAHASINWRKVPSAGDTVQAAGAAGALATTGAMPAGVAASCDAAGAGGTEAGAMSLVTDLAGSTAARDLPFLPAARRCQPSPLSGAAGSKLPVDSIPKGDAVGTAAWAATHAHSALMTRTVRLNRRI
ncbi:hypothetical protein CF70_008220 [Cupriavidus sp. SK-3]|nr:hypothetical protein CF70_008220 [Cupriavidus sp. SK-3]